MRDAVVAVARCRAAEPADPDMIGARNDHRCPVVAGGVFLAVLGAFQGRFWPETSPSRSRQALKTQSGRALAHKEASHAEYGKEGVRVRVPASALLCSTTRFDASRGDSQQRRSGGGAAWGLVPL
jgi:hypothetical protein